MSNYTKIEKLQVLESKTAFGKTAKIEKKNLNLLYYSHLNINSRYCSENLNN